ncbi:putative secreted protein (Por secretion system target) [Aquimarina sp. MAR_2010_214]|uniref:glycoside hydrolase family 19 protein n=1 Tax=Aquimarina sp. MAR_2010_214 TaxID=1250026 RepID=UPI000CAD691E|nr:glycoside hydrolase family 19 protein [Aquimarina sp. MAR_2010_214]PKV50306.1 putative secreted protein (Por secretion system target) [Aquimarina sp. MAR_2010_214]
MTRKLTTPKTHWILCRKSWIMIFTVLFFTTNLTFSKNHNTYSEISKTTYLFSLDESSATAKPLQVSELINKDLWNTLFPYRFGAKDTGNGWELDPKDDFYTFDSFIEAINRMSKIKVVFERRCGTNAYRVTRTDKTTGVSKVIRTDVDFDAPRNAEKEIVINEVDYGSFLEEGNLETRKREITAFFANISHETTGGWATAPGGQFSWGLHFREEPTNASYAYPDTNYPPTPGKSYKGRGPIQLSYNYNYGPASEFIFGDKQILLDNPEKVIEDAALAFQTAIWFWMTPQYPKPSAHDVMVNKWVPNELDKTKNRVPGLGMTVNIINGGVECGQGTEKPQVLDRIGYYERFTEIYQIGTDMDGVHDLSDCGCKDMSKYGGDSADLTAEPCAQKPQITFTSPKNNELIEQATLSAVSVSLTIDEKDTKLVSATTSVDNQTFEGVSFSWTPSKYASHTLTTTAKFENGTTATSSIKVTIWDGVNLDCQEVAEWKETRIYKDKGTFVKYNNKVYKNKWYADSSNVPGSDGVWELVKECGVSNGSAPVITWESPSSGQVIEQNELSAITLKASATDADGTVQSFVFKYNGADISATSTGNNYSASFTPTAFGEITITAVATDNENKTSEKIISFTVKEKTIGGNNNAPTVSITSPGDNTSFEAGTSVSITVDASDNDGTIAKVEFFNNGSKIGENNSSPFSYTLENVVAGNYSLTAKATDNQGASSTSTAVKITVTSGGGSGNCVDIQQYVAGTSYGLNDEVVNEGEKFSCDIPGWCSSTAAWAYAPGTGAHWQMAWTKTGACGKNNLQVGAKGYTVYPTVTKDIVNLTIHTKNRSLIRIGLYDFSGKLMYSQTFSELQKNTKKMFSQDVSHLKNGLYVFKIQVDKNIYFEKILKK